MIDFKTQAKLIDSKLLQYSKIYFHKAGITDEMIEKHVIELKQEYEQKHIDDSYKTILK